MDDFELLERYVSQGSRQSLDELVRRHLAMVHAAALRQVGDPNLAEDVTQAVFVEFMRCAPRLSKRVVIAGWLFTATRFISFKLVRAQQRRARHEKEAAALRPSACTFEADDSTARLSPLLDKAIASLSRSDRDAVVMRYLQGRTFRQVGDAQHVSEEAARKRLTRAIGRLRATLQRRGLVMPEDALSASLAAIALRPAPPALGPRVILSLNKPAIAGGAFGLANFISRILFMLNAKTVSLAIVVLLAICGAGGLVKYYAWSANAATNGPHDGPGTTPVATLFNAFDAANAGNADALIRCFDQLPPAMETRLRGIARGMGVTNRLKEAIAGKFGDAEAAKLVWPLGMLPPMNYTTMQHAKTVINGNTATIQLQHIGTMPFVKVGDAWKFPPAMEKLFPPELARQDATLQDLDQLANDVKAGKYATLHDLRIKMNRTSAKIENDALPPRDMPARPEVLAPAATPKETIAAFCWAGRTGDDKALIACLKDPSEVQIGQMERSAAISGATGRFTDAVAENFGRKEANRIAATLGLETGLTGSLLKNAPATEIADKAHVDLRPSAINGFDLVKTGAVWQIDPSFLPPPNLPWAARYKDHYLPAYVQLTAEIDAGKYESTQQLQPIVKKLHDEMKVDYQAMVAPTTQNAK